MDFSFVFEKIWPRHMMNLKNEFSKASFEIVCIHDRCININFDRYCVYDMHIKMRCDVNTCATHNSCDPAFHKCANHKIRLLNTVFVKHENRFLLLFFFCVCVCVFLDSFQFSYSIDE